jgi:polysaccharide biosynthesis transport protein
MHMPPDTDHSHARDDLRPRDGSLGDSPLAHYLDALWRFRWLLVGGSVLAAVVTYVIALTLTPRFEATAVLMVTASKTGEQVASGLDVRNFRAFVQNQTLASEIIKEFALNTTPQRFLDDQVNVQDVRGTNLLTVGVTVSSADLAARIANAMANRAVALSRSVEQSESVVARDVIKGQLDAARDRLTQSRAALETYQRQAQVELLEKRINVLTDQQADIQNLTVDLEGQRAYLRQAEQDLTQQDRVRGVQRSVQLQAPRAVDDDARRERERSAEEADRQLARETAREAAPRRADQTDTSVATPAPVRPRRQEPDAEPPARPELRDALIDPYINPSYEILQQQVTAARSRVAQLERKRAEMLKSRSSDGQLPALADFYTRKARQTELEMQQQLAEKIYVDVATRFEQARLQIAGRSAQLQLLDPALPPDRKVYPREKLMASAALVLTLSVLIAGVVAVTGIGKALARGRREPAA